MDALMTSREPPAYELRFRSLSNPGRGFSFACDASGGVDLDSLGKCALSNYLYARTVVGREFFTPVVQPCESH
jgi:hypothetical protein